MKKLIIPFVLGFFLVSCEEDTTATPTPTETKEYVVDAFLHGTIVHTFTTEDAGEIIELGRSVVLPDGTILVSTVQPSSSSTSAIGFVLTPKEVVQSFTE